MNPPFRVEISSAGRRRWIDVHGEFDTASVPEFERLAVAILGAPGSIIVDITGATILDSSALSALIRLRREAVDRDADFSLIIGPAWQARLLEQSGVCEYLCARCREPADRGPSSGAA